MSLYPQIRILLSAFFGVLLATSVATAGQKCASVLPVDPTGNVIGYLGELIEQGAVNKVGLERLADSLSSGDYKNPITEVEAGKAPAAKIQRDGLGDLLKESIDTVKLEAWLVGVIRKLNADQVSRGETKEETADIATKLEFVRLSGGSYWLAGKKGLEEEPFQKDLLKHEVVLEQDFEISSTVITQQHWLDIMGDLPKDIFVNTDGSYNKVAPDGRVYSPDHPLTDITFWSSLVFANRLSEAHGLEPVYQIDSERMSGEPGKGTYQTDLVFKVDNPAPFTINSADGDYYKAEGYRLPTHFEMEYLGRYAQGDTYTNLHFGKSGEDFSELEKYAWRQEEVMPVGLKLPMVIDGQFQIYDYDGNISEVLFSWYEIYQTWNAKHKRVSVNPQSDLNIFMKNNGLIASETNLVSQKLSPEKNRLAPYFIGVYAGTTITFAIKTKGFRLVRSLP